MNQGERRLSDPALTAMRHYAWPGNVRELISKIRRAVVMSDNRLMTASDLGLERPPIRDGCRQGDPPGNVAAPFPELRYSLENSAATLEVAKAKVEEQLVRDCLVRHAQNVTSTARDLGISRVTLYRLIEKYQIREKTTRRMN